MAARSGSVNARRRVDFSGVEVAKKAAPTAKRQLSDKNAVGMWLQYGVGLYGEVPLCRLSNEEVPVFPRVLGSVKVLRTFADNRC
jgi:hypothetical protein